jgi:hypothetical protein
VLPELAAITGIQRGVFTRRQALDAGFDPGEVRASLRTGEWITVRRGVYVTQARWRAAAGDPTERHRMAVAAAFLVTAPGAVASHGSACAVLGLATASPLDDVVALTRGSGESHRGRTLAIRVAPLDPDELAVVDGMPTTCATRTVLDLARLWSFRDALVTADDALRQGLTSRDSLIDLQVRRPSWPRGGRVSRVIGFADGRSESVGESVARVVLAEGGLPPPALQYEVRDGGELVARVDFCWEEEGLIGEFDGRVKYTDRDVLIREKRREDRLRALGWRFLRFGWEDLQRPRTLCARARALLEIPRAS